VLVVINKESTAKTAALTISHGTAFDHAETYVITSASSHPVHGANVPITLTNAFVYTMPALSVSTLVLVP
jgi:hypothetical protein